ncbi:hypothetical protein JCM10450v2_003141 [Rhodotorula kratochvilovae]
MWDTVLRDPQERTAFHALLDDYFRRPFPLPTSTPDPEPALPPRTLPPAVASGASSPKPASPSPEEGPKRPAGLVAQQKTAGGFDASSGRAFAKAVFSSKGPMNRAEMEKQKVVGPLAVNAPRTYSGPPPPRRGASGSETAAASPAEERVRAMYDYEGSVPEDLPVREGEELVVVERVDADWLRCRNSVGSTGLVPSTYTQSI